MQSNLKKKMSQSLPIRSICDKCKHVERHNLISYTIMLIQTLLLVLGILFVIVMIVIGPSYLMNGLVNKKFNNFAQENTDGLRELALEYTTYDGSDSFEFTYDLFKNFPRIRYVLPSQYKYIQEPLSTFELGGDCKNSAILFVGMLLSSGVEAYVECNNEQMHCVSVIPHNINMQKASDRYMVVDLTSDVVYVFQNEIDFWANPESYDIKFNEVKTNG